MFKITLHHLVIPFKDLLYVTLYAKYNLIYTFLNHIQKAKLIGPSINVRMLNVTKK